MYLRCPRPPRNVPRTRPELTSEPSHNPNVPATQPSRTLPGNLQESSPALQTNCPPEPFSNLPQNRWFPNPSKPQKLSQTKKGFQHLTNLPNTVPTELSEPQNHSNSQLSKYVYILQNLFKAPSGTFFQTCQNIPNTSRTLELPGTWLKPSNTLKIPKA